MDILDSLFHDIRAINTHIHAQDVQLEKALKGYTTGKPSKTKSKPKLTKSRGALPVPSQRYSKAKLPTKGSLKRLPSSKSKVGLSKSKSTRIAVKKKPALPPVARSSRGGGASQALKFPQKPALPKNGARAAPKRALVAKDSSGPAAQRVSHSHLAPAVKKPPTLTDSSPKLQLRSEFRQHMEEIERMKELLSDSREEGEVLREVNGVVSLLLNKSQGYLAKADQSLRNADAQAPSHYKSIIRKLLDNQTKTTIVVSPKPTPRKVPIYKKAPIEYTDRSQKDLDELLQQHGDPAEGSRLGASASASGRATFNFPDIFDRIYNKPMADNGAGGPSSGSTGSSSSGKATKAPVGRQLEKDFDLSLFSPAKLIERAQQSLTSAISSETISSLRRETAASMDDGGSSSSGSQKPPPGRAPLKAEKDLDDLVREVLDSVDRHSQRITEPSPSAATMTRGPLAVDTSYSDDTSHPPTATQMASSTRSTGDANRLDDDLSLLTPSLFSPKPTPQRSSDEEQQRDDDAELELIRNSNRSERERIHGQMQAMRSKLDSLLSSSATATAAGTAVAATDGAKDSGVDVERLLPKLVGSTSLQSKDDESKLTEHEDLLQKVMKALMKKANKDKDGDAAADKEHKAERRASRRATKATGGSATGVSQQPASSSSSSSSSSGSSVGAAPLSSSAPSLALPVDQAKESSAATVDGGSAESKSDDRRQSVGKLVPVPPTGQRSSSSGHTPRSRKLNAAMSLSTMHEVDDEADDDSERTSHSSRRHKHTDSSKAIFGSSRPTEKSLAAVEAVKERTKQFEKTRPTEVDMRF